MVKNSLLIGLTSSQMAGKWNESRLSRWVIVPFSMGNTPTVHATYVPPAKFTYEDEEFPSVEVCFQVKRAFTC